MYSQKRLSQASLPNIKYLAKKSSNICPGYDILEGNIVLDAAILAGSLVHKFPKGNMKLQ
jgi:hypothetical protein